ncbi:MAG: hypothetical protein CL930_13980 [Deltaproteobacteria bacterium]|mgnify:CR=1 FL=1|nr:hypothetical protein [Deltaproteobacteria bacterium]|tara:strand:- start:279 stop:1061 length:783 start_codon:yes stop_codon:yes gene_type:complete
MLHLNFTGTAWIFVLLMGCPDPPPEVAGVGDDEQAAKDGEDQQYRGGREGDPDSMDLSPGGTMLLDMESVVPQKTQAELAAEGDTVTISGTLKGTCDGGQLRIDVIELGVEHSDAGPMIGPLTALMPSSPGEYSLLCPKNKNVQLAALCDIDKDNKIVQGTDKLAPGVALGLLEEDQVDINLVFPGENDTPVNVGSAGPGDVQPPGDETASIPSSEAGIRDRSTDDEPAGPPPTDGEEIPPPPEMEEAEAEAEPEAVPSE